MKPFLIKKSSSILFSMILTSVALAQKPEPPIPVEAFFGHEEFFFQMALKKSLTADHKFNFFALTTFTADYGADKEDDSMVIPVQLSYDIGKGFGVMAGAEITNKSGFSPIIGPQFNYASREWLIVNVSSFFLNEDSDFNILGIYEYKPAFNENWALYIRLQFMVNRSLKLGTNNINYLHLRAGTTYGKLTFGLAVNFEQRGAEKGKAENYGLFVRWSFK